MNFFNPNVIFEGTVQLDNDPSASNHAVRKSWLEANAIMAIHSDSSVHAETVLVGGQKQLKIKSLAITDVQVDSTETSLANWISSNYSNGNEVQEGDMIILTNTSSSRTETYIHNGGTAGTANDFTEIQGSDVSGSEVRSYFSGGTGIDYNSSTGAISANSGDIRGLFSAGSGLSYDNANGVYTFNADTDGVSEGSTNLYFTQARCRGAVQADPAAGNLLTYASASGNIGVAISSVFAQFSAGSGLAFSNGQYSLTANTDGVSEGSSNLYFTNARAQAAISVTGDGLAKSDGAISLTADTDDISEGSTNQYFTDARARGAVSADSGVTNQLLTYNSGTGKFSVDLDDLRKEFLNQSLTANTFLTLNHGLGKKYVQVSAYDSSDNLVQLDVQATDANNLKVKAGSNKTGMTIIISL